MAKPLHSAIYEGWVRHQRHRPILHDFAYRLFMVYLDLDELDTVFAGSFLWSSRRKNIAYFRREDHLGEPKVPLKVAVYDLVQSRIGLRLEGPIRLLTHLRYWGYCFNPVSFYFCYDTTGQKLVAIVAEINNTPWGEQYCYVLPITPGHERSVPKKRAGLVDRHHFQFAKDFHISPLLGMAMTYDWWLTVPSDQLTIHMRNIQEEQIWFTAHLALQRQPITAPNLRRVLCHYPWMTVTIIRAIYWQALRTWLKGAKFYAHPLSKE